MTGNTKGIQLGCLKDIKEGRVPAEGRGKEAGIQSLGFTLSAMGGSLEKSFPL